ISLSDTLTLSLTTDTTVTAKFTNPADVAAPPSSRAFYLDQNTPNPFNPSTTLRFGLPDAGHVTLAVYDVNGRLVRNLAGRIFLSGQHDVVWDGCDNNGRAVASGVYLVRLTAREGVLTRRVTLLR
ncbi:MAG TPA: FlgD immunoglobulin-like domain containing protein, partial [Candidatus Latescibacteria bacterium]|nr:FlgD immunoglobulin-like domain containing protein [Candidatus Latescibacterota bacterium]